MELINLKFNSQLAYKLMKMFIIFWSPFSYCSGPYSLSNGDPFPDSKATRTWSHHPLSYNAQIKHECNNTSTPTIWTWLAQRQPYLLLYLYSKYMFRLGVQGLKNFGI